MWLREERKIGGTGEFEIYLKEAHITIHLYSLYLCLTEETCSRLSKDSNFFFSGKAKTIRRTILAIAFLLGRWMNILEISFGIRSKTI